MMNTLIQLCAYVLLYQLVIVSATSILCLF